MATGSDHTQSTNDLEGAPEDEDTLADGEWPVADQYRIEPGQRVGDQDDATVVVPAVPPARPPRRFPPDIAPGLLLVLLAALLLVPAAILAATWASDDESSPTATSGTVGTTPRAAPGTTPAATPERQVVPEVVGEPLGEARSLLEDAGLTIRTEVVSSERPAAEVLRQSPAADARADRNSVVLLTVSAGPERITVPDVVGMDEDEADRALREAGLRPQVRRVRSDEPAGTVLRQRPAAGADVDPDTVVRLDVAQPAPPEPPAIDVPDVVGLAVADARGRLRELGLRSTLTRVVSSKAAGTVVAQSPRAGAELDKGGTVELRVSTGPAKATVVDVTGLDELSARQQLEAAGFEVEIVDEPTSDVSQDGLVVAQDPQGGSRAEEGSVVTLTVARLA